MTDTHACPYRTRRAVSAMPSIRLSRTRSPIFAEQLRLIHLVRQFVNHNHLPVASLVHILDMHARANRPRGHDRSYSAVLFDLVVP
jgi:hypothetical protein